MAYFAQLDDSNYVTQVIVVADENAVTEADGIKFCQTLFGADTQWIQTYVDGERRRQYAGTGFQYIPDRDLFLGPMPRDGFSYELDTVDYVWVSTNKPPLYVGYAPIAEQTPTELLSILALPATDTFVDLGSGDGRVAVAAAKYGMQATGVEANPALLRQSQIVAQEAGVAVNFIEADLVSVDLTPYTVIHMYLGKPLCDAVLPKLKELPSGKTIISGDYCYPEWAPTSVYTIDNVTFYIWKT